MIDRPVSRSIAGVRLLARWLDGARLSDWQGFLLSSYLVNYLTRLGVSEALGFQTAPPFEMVLENIEKRETGGRH